MSKLKFVVFDGIDGGYEAYETEAEAMKAAKTIIDYARNEDGWPEELTNTFVAKISHEVIATNVVKIEDIDEDGCYINAQGQKDDRYEGIDTDRFAYLCDYEVVKTSHK